MKLSQFKFKLPEDKIALHPAKYRDESRLMVVHKATGEIEHVVFKDLSLMIQRYFLHVYMVIKKRPEHVSRCSCCVS